MSDIAQYTKKFPMIQNHTLFIYEGDTFDMELNLNLTESGSPFDISEDDVITFEFKNVVTNEEVASKSFTNITGTKLIFNWDSEFTKKFPKGRYTYRMRFNSDYVTTIVADNYVMVV